jgi:hypothetical protein
MWFYWILGSIILLVDYYERREECTQGFGEQTWKKETTWKILS